jgi:hypothetical protein
MQPVGPRGGDEKKRILIQAVMFNYKIDRGADAARDRQAVNTTDRINRVLT